MLLSPRTLTRHNCKAVDRSTVSSIWDYERDALRVCVCVCAWLIDALVEAVSEGVDTFTPTTSKTQRQDKVRPLPAKEKKTKTRLISRRPYWKARKMFSAPTVASHSSLNPFHPLKMRSRALPWRVAVSRACTCSDLPLLCVARSL